MTRRATADAAEGRAIDGAGRASFDEVYRAERPRVVRLAYLLVRSEAVAEELAQEAFVRLYRCFDEVESPGGFLHTATVRLAATWWRRDRMEGERLRLVPPVRDA